MDADRFVTVLTDNATMRIGGGGAIPGRAAIRDDVARLFGGFASVSHTLIRAYEHPPRLIYEAEVTYGLKVGRRLVVPYVNVLRFEAELIDDYRIYLDLSALNAPSTG